METRQTNSDSFDESQSIQVIREMIEVSKKNLRKDGLLFIVWGWILFIIVFSRFMIKAVIINQVIESYVNKTIIFLLLIGVVISCNYLLTKRYVVRTYTGQILSYLWGAIIFLNLYILFYQLRANMKIDMLYSQYMLMFALGTFVTGGIIKFKPLIYGSISFIVLVQIGFFFHNEIGILLAACSFITGLSIPGHILYSKRNS
jgi:hypothetical protein